MTGNLTLLFLILWPMAGGAASFIVGRYDKRLRDLTASAVTLVELGAALGCCWLLGAELSLPGVCGLGLHFKLGGFRLIYAVTIAYMWAATTLFSHEYLEGHHNRNRYYLFVLLTLGAIMGVFLSDDLYTTFVFFEMMSLFSLIMVIQDETPTAVSAAQTYLAIAIIGGLATLAGLILLYAKLGTLNIADLAHAVSGAAGADRAGLYLAGGLTFAGFAAKAAIFPAHIWLPTAHTAAPAPSSALLSGLLTKSGLFGVLVLSAGPFLHDPNWGLMLLVLALITMVLGAVLALFSVNIKRTLACSSMSQLGFILTGIAMQCFLGEENDLAVRGVLLYMVGHSLIKLVLFLAAGVVHMNTHKLELNDIRGFGRGKPLFLFAFLMGGLGLMGMPLWNGYLGKTLIHESIVEHLHHLARPSLSLMSAASERLLFQFAEWVFLVSGAMTAAYVTKLFVVLFLSEPAPELHQKKRYISPMNAGILGLSAAVLPLLGLLPYHLADPLAFLAAPFMRGPAEHHAVGYFLLESLKGAGISLGLGAAIYGLFVRPVLMRRDLAGGILCLDLWPKWLDLEWGVFRPLLLGLLPSLGGALARAVDRASTILIKVLPFLGALGAHLLDLIIAGPISLILSRAAQVRFVRVPEDKDFGVYREETPSIQMLLPSSLAYSLMAFAVGLICVMAWLVL